MLIQQKFGSLDNLGKNKIHPKKFGSKKFGSTKFCVYKKAWSKNIGLKKMVKEKCWVKTIGVGGPRQK